MGTKQEIISSLGEKQLLLPGLVQSGLAANDRVKYFFTLLQLAREQCEQPAPNPPDLQREREASGVADAELDGVIAASRGLPGGRCRIPGAGALLGQVIVCLKEMLAPIELARELDLESGAGEYRKRLAAVAKVARAARKDIVPAALISALTSGERKRGDTAHLLVMDLHKALNRLQGELSRESVDGARVYGLRAQDKELVRAFMRGLNSTQALKLDHPGLGTTAALSGRQLVLQNDIGTTDAHVLVVHVEGLAATLTYSDVHLERLLFFQSLFEKFTVKWEETRSRRESGLNEGGIYHLCIGAYKARDREQLAQYLEFLGSRLVFLIDWNRARKRLRPFVRKRSGIAVLKWAADNGYGHMSFLKIGGDMLIYDAMQFAIKGAPRFGEDLRDMLGRERALAFLKFVVRTCAEGVLTAKPDSLIRDEVRAELANYFHSAERDLLELACEHAALLVELASGVRDGVLQLQLAGSNGALARIAARAKAWETAADSLLNQVRAAVDHSAGAVFFKLLLEAADDVADSLEEAAFHFTLFPPRSAPEDAHERLRALADLLVAGAQEYLKALTTARYVRRGADRDDMRDFLEAVHRITTVEHDSDQAQREIKSALLAAESDARGLFVVAEVARNLEEAADALMHSGLVLRDHVMGAVAAS
ncbi:MAG: DUF47 family protein [Burkholderiales bacterium]|nr:DUF47 family protein [Burkholderiales bacterium]